MSVSGVPHAVWVPGGRVTARLKPAGTHDHRRPRTEVYADVSWWLPWLRISDEFAPGRYHRLDRFTKVLSLLCPNLTDASRGIAAEG